MRWMNLEPIIQSGVSNRKKERESQISYIDACIWNLERQYLRSYMQVSKGDTDILDTVREGEDGMIQEKCTETCTLPSVK